MKQVEKIAALYQKEVLPYIVHLEAKDRNALLKKLENKTEDSQVREWKALLATKRADAEQVAQHYNEYLHLLNDLNEEELKKVKNKNIYFLRKNGEALKEAFLLTMPILEETVELYPAPTAEEKMTVGSLIKGKKQKKKDKKLKKKNRVKKERNKKRRAN